MGDMTGRLHFRLMAVGYAFRDYLDHRDEVIEEAGIGPGFHLLDYGCGTGSYTIPAAEKVGVDGLVYALDRNPLALRTVEKKASRKGIRNIETVLSDCATGLPNAGLDAVLFLETLSMLTDAERVIAELHRVLKPGGVLAFSDHPMEERDTVPRFEGEGRFRLSARGKRVYRFSRM